MIEQATHVYRDLRTSPELHSVAMKATLQMLCEECNRKKSSYDEAGAKGTYDPIVVIPGFAGPDGQS